MSVPCIVFEEHHEAFYFWKEAAATGVLPGRGVSLVHIDEHSDMDLPTLQGPMLGPQADLDQTRAFILKELNIANFIWPAVLHGLFSEVWWHREHQATLPYDGPICVFTTDPQRRAMVWAKGPLPPELQGKPDASQARFARVKNLSDIRPQGPVALDICLDYFSCNLTPEREPVALEVTTEEYERFKNNPYHLLRISPGAPVSPSITPENKHLLVFGRSDGRGEGRTATDEEAFARLDRFGAWLKGSDLDCRFIGVSLSRISGYTPRDLCDRLLERLSGILKERFDADIRRRSAFASGAPS